MARTMTTTSDYVEDKRADFSKVNVPAYIGASYSSDLHTIGSLRAFEEIPHSNKWDFGQRFRNMAGNANTMPGWCSTPPRSGMTCTPRSAPRT